MRIPEDFLHYVWKFQLFTGSSLSTTQFESIEILNAGEHNLNSGPDFSNARAFIGNTLWIGNVEIHLRSSDWYKHGHDLDPAYDNVILHVVGVHDAEIFRSDRSAVPVLEIGRILPESVLSRYLDLIGSFHWIPCQEQIAKIPSIHIHSMLTRAVVERLELKSQQVKALLQEVKGNWEEAFYIYLARNYGFRVNALPFEMLARSLPLNVLKRYVDRPVKIEALVFGQAGLINPGEMDSYQALLYREYEFLKKKHHLRPIKGYLWKFMRLRPHNFPTRRLAQFADLMVNNDHLFSKVIEAENTAEIIKIFKTSGVNEYWRNHYRFGESSSDISTGNIGESALRGIVINTVAVFLLAFGQASGRQELIDKSISLLELLGPENNSIVKGFNRIGVRAENSLMTQGFIQLKRFYCDEKKCLSCGLGNKLINC